MGPGHDKLLHGDSGCNLRVFSEVWICVQIGPSRVHAPVRQQWRYLTLISHISLSLSLSLSLTLSFSLALSLSLSLALSQSMVPPPPKKKGSRIKQSYKILGPIGLILILKENL